MDLVRLRTVNRMNSIMAGKVLDSFTDNQFFSSILLFVAVVVVEVERYRDLIRWKVGRMYRDYLMVVSTAEYAIEKYKIGA